MQLVWSTYFGGTGAEAAFSIAVDGSGNVFIGGFTNSTSGFPLQNPGAGAYYDNTCNNGDAFIAKFSGSTLGLMWGTYFGGALGEQFNSMAIDALRAPRGQPSVAREQFNSMAIDGSGNVFAVGIRQSTLDFPLQNPGGAYYDNTPNGGWDAFIAKFSEANLQLVWSTYFGGNAEDQAHGVAVDGSGNVFMVGFTGSTSGFPLQNLGGVYYNDTHIGGSWDAFIAKFSSTTLGLA